MQLSVLFLQELNSVKSLLLGLLFERLIESLTLPNLTVIVPAKCVHLSTLQQGNGVMLTSNNVLDVLVAELHDLSGHQHILRATNAKLSIIVQSPSIIGKFVVLLLHLHE